MKITSIHARTILDSRGNPTVEADVILADGSLGRAAVPSGASTGSQEALELRDNDPHEFHGRGVTKAVAHVNDIIAPALVGQEAWDQQLIDRTLRELDGTAEKKKLGANALLAVSLAIAKAQAAHDGVPLYRHIAQIAGTARQSLPMPMMNILNGGQHAAGSTDIQEFMIIPSSAKSFYDAVRMGAETYQELKALLAERGFVTAVGDEGGFAPSLGSNRAALDIITEAITRAGYTPGTDITLALDVAASELVDDAEYDFAIEGARRNRTDMVAWYQELTAHYPIVSIEDGLSENDWEGWQELTRTLGDKLQLVGDDLLVTNTELLRRAIDDQAANAILIKPNQIGTLSETIEAVKMAQAAGWKTIISHRSGETEDTTIAHLAVGLNAGQIKTGSLARTDRTAKYNELLRIAEDPSLHLYDA